MYLHYLQIVYYLYSWTELQNDLPSLYDVALAKSTHWAIGQQLNRSPDPSFLLIDYSYIIISKPI